MASIPYAKVTRITAQREAVVIELSSEPVLAGAALVLQFSPDQVHEIVSRLNRSLLEIESAGLRSRH